MKKSKIERILKEKQSSDSKSLKEKLIERIDSAKNVEELKDILKRICVLTLKK